MEVARGMRAESSGTKAPVGRGVDGIHAMA
jgi:hypothetical protein